MGPDVDFADIANFFLDLETFGATFVWNELSILPILKMYSIHIAQHFGSSGTVSSSNIEGCNESKMFLILWIQKYFKKK